MRKIEEKCEIILIQNSSLLDFLKNYTIWVNFDNIFKNYLEMLEIIKNWGKMWNNVDPQLRATTEFHVFSGSKCFPGGMWWCQICVCIGVHCVLVSAHKTSFFLKKRADFLWKKRPKPLIAVHSSIAVLRKKFLPQQLWPEIKLLRQPGLRSLKILANLRKNI